MHDRSNGLVKSEYFTHALADLQGSNGVVRRDVRAKIYNRYSPLSLPLCRVSFWIVNPVNTDILSGFQSIFLFLSLSLFLPLSFFFFFDRKVIRSDYSGFEFEQTRFELLRFFFFLFFFLSLFLCLDSGLDEFVGLGNLSSSITHKIQS